MCAEVSRLLFADINRAFSASALRLLYSF